MGLINLPLSFLPSFLFPHHHKKMKKLKKQQKNKIYLIVTAVLPEFNKIFNTVKHFPYLTLAFAFVLHCVVLAGLYHAGSSSYSFFRVYVQPIGRCMGLLFNNLVTSWWSYLLFFIFYLIVNFNSSHELFFCFLIVRVNY